MDFASRESRAVWWSRRAFATAWLLAILLHGLALLLLAGLPFSAPDLSLDEPLPAEPVVLARLVSTPPPLPPSLRPVPAPAPTPPVPEPPAAPPEPVTILSAPEAAVPLLPESLAVITNEAEDPSPQPQSESGTTTEATTSEEPPLPPAASLPLPGRIPMEAHLGEFELGAEPLGRGAIEISFPAEDRYRIRLTAEAQRWLKLLVKGQVLVESEGRLDSTGLVPDLYRQGRPGTSIKTSTFDWAKGEALLDDGAHRLPLEPGLQDRLSVAFQIGWTAERRTQAGQVGLPPGEEFRFAVASRGAIHRMTFRVSPPEDLVLPGGILVTAVRLTSDPLQTERAGTIDFWLDPADRHLPARIRYSEPSGRALDFLAIRAVFDAPPAEPGQLDK